MWDRLAIASLVFALACGDQVVGTFAAASGSTGTQTGFSPQSTGSAPGDDTGATGATGADMSPTAGDSEADGSSGPAPVAAPETCDGIDNDLDGLVDEIGPATTTCGACTLLQGAGQAWWSCDLEKSWADAQAYCEGFGAGLARVQTPEHGAFVLEALTDTFMFYWLGAREEPEVEGVWAWIDGTPVAAYTNWAGTQPDDFEAAQDCLRLTFGIVDANWFPGSWDDFYCDFPTNVLCSAPHDAP
jgi:hypothetical protein